MAEQHRGSAKGVPAAAVRRERMKRRRAQGGQVECPQERGRPMGRGVVHWEQRLLKVGVGVEIGAGAGVGRRKREPGCCVGGGVGRPKGWVLTWEGVEGPRAVAWKALAKKGAGEQSRVSASQ